MGAIIEKIKKGDIQSITDIGQYFDCRVFISKRDVTQVALGDAGLCGKLVDSIVFGGSEAGNSFSNLHMCIPFCYKERINAMNYSL